MTATANTIPTEAQYLANERHSHILHLQRVEQAPLADRKAGEADYLELMRDLPRLAERAEWILDGSYGKGAQLAAQAIKAQKRGNRPAAFGQLVAALECGCPQALASRAWNALEAIEAGNVDAILCRVLDAPEEE